MNCPRSPLAPLRFCVSFRHRAPKTSSIRTDKAKCLSTRADCTTKTFAVLLAEARRTLAYLASLSTLSTSPLDHPSHAHCLATRRAVLERNLGDCDFGTLVWNAWTDEASFAVLQDKLITERRITEPDRWLTAEMATAYGHAYEDEAAFSLEQTVRRWILQQMSASPRERYTLHHVGAWPDVDFVVHLVDGPNVLPDISLTSDVELQLRLLRP